MDIGLEVVDTFVADKFYAWLLPLNNAVAGINGTAPAAVSTWEYHPATHMLYLEPSEYAYQSAWPRDYAVRQGITLFFITCNKRHNKTTLEREMNGKRRRKKLTRHSRFFGLLNYFLLATLSYHLVFDKATLKHPKYLKDQMWLEIHQAVTAMPGMAIPTALLFLTEVRGYTRLYDSSEEGPGIWYDRIQPVLFIFFTDFCIYWIHRGLHHPLIYKRLHKPHHKWIMPTPYASYAFHPLDGFAQSVPYHVYPVFFPMHKLVFVGAFIFVNFWTIIIHDGEYITDNPIINGSACHSAHHLYFNYNYGQFLTLWDRLGGSYRKPNPEWFDKATKMSQETWQSGVKEMEKIQKTVEGNDDRTYSVGVAAKKNN
ncbi:Delta7-sterol 5-desaturase [Geosmithia morbida]|uniref:Delta7-sterol 5-desaturase n=1 Tax=Geosmithia morbida TaxID=1094350 RepID=A0A9P4YQJ7_9HYPO|nr:Delta7-sterol 5-desaturase [Geosmithia morbida]KAF4120930.1 Delta7-sterol 5-desaturase [Geosmithia morbida]